MRTMIVKQTITEHAKLDSAYSSLAKLRATREKLRDSMRLKGASWDSDPELDSLVARLIEHRV